MKRDSFVWLLLFLLVTILSFLPASAQAGKSELSPSDCAKCHTSQPADIDSNGAKHKSAISCTDCHTGHRPESKNNIPVCSMCHQGKPHFDQKARCLSCHTNPHTPLKITFGKPMTEPCLTCHTSQIKQLKDFRSKHSLKNCTDCHDVHRKIPQCTQCHKPHSAQMTAADCSKCHKAHQPKNVAYASGIESQFCGACHKSQFALLTASKAKHNAQNCAACHQDKHKMVPKCQDCHGDKHPAGIMARFPRCVTCHKNPHDLNNWTAPAPAPAKKKGQ